MSLVAPWYLKSSQTRDQNFVLCTGRQILIPCITREVHAPHKKNFMCLQSAAFAIPHSSYSKSSLFMAPTNLLSLPHTSWRSPGIALPSHTHALQLVCISSPTTSVISENNEHHLLSFCLGCCHYTHLQYYLIFAAAKSFSHVRLCATP